MNKDTDSSSEVIDITTVERQADQHTEYPIDLFDESQKSLKKNHPKNAIGYALATAHHKDTETVFEKYVIKSVRDARDDAATIGLIRYDGKGCQLTPEGRKAVGRIISHHQGIENALREIDAMTGSGARLVGTCPVIGEQVRLLMIQHRSTQLLVDTLDQFEDEASLAEVAKAICRQSPRLGVRMFVSSRDEAREMVFKNTAETKLDLSAFDDGIIYSTHTTFQYKATLYHLGILTERGIDTIADLDPKFEKWELERDTITSPIYRNKYDKQGDESIVESDDRTTADSEQRDQNEADNSSLLEEISAEFDML